MLIPRLHLFELEDQPWFPAIIRDLGTDYIHFVETTFHLHRPVVPLLAQALRTTESQQVIDLCSGGAGPIPALLEALAAEGLEVRFTLTDRFPNLAASGIPEACRGGIDAANRAAHVRCSTQPRGRHALRCSAVRLPAGPRCAAARADGRPANRR